MLETYELEAYAEGEADRAIRKALIWFMESRFQEDHGVGCLPFYCDANLVGPFAVSPTDLASGSDEATFQVFVALSMYQALRDVVIMRHQREMSVHSARSLIDMSLVAQSVFLNECSTLSTAASFERECNVSKSGRSIDCRFRPGSPCHVKDASILFNRMGDMGKLPTSAWFSHWKNGGIGNLLRQVCKEHRSATARATALASSFGKIHRVGRKLATMFVSAMSTPALAPGLAPWFPSVDGNELVVVDTNVARAVDALRAPGSAKTYGARERWVRGQAARIDLTEFSPWLPRYSPRIVQQALYAYCSRSNRVARSDRCAMRTVACDACATAICPM